MLVTVINIIVDAYLIKMSQAMLKQAIRSIKICDLRIPDSYDAKTAKICHLVGFECRVSGCQEYLGRI